VKERLYEKPDDQRGVNYLLLLLRLSPNSFLQKRVDERISAHYDVIFGLARFAFIGILVQNLLYCHL
jgi:hypothetical protein